jgi:ABC-type transporter Mla subunit MlaD
VAKNTRVPSAVGSIPVVGDLVKQADAQAQWLQELVEQNARLVGQMPATIKTLNDSLERFNQTIGRLDRVVSRIEGASAQLIAPLEQMTPQLDRQVALLTNTVERILGLLNELPGAGIVRRVTGTGGRAGKPAAGDDAPA